MNEKPEFELLVEIAKLLKRFGPDAFENLSRNLASPDFTQRLVSILGTSARIGREAKVSRTAGSQKRQDYRSSLIELGKSEPEKSTLLLSFYDQLMAKTALPTLRDVQSFVSDNGLYQVKATDRKKTIISLIKALSALPLEEVKTKLAGIRTAVSKDDRSLEGWSKIILEKGDTNKSAAT